MIGMARRDPPQENPYASPQVSSGPAAHPIAGWILRDLDWRIDRLRSGGRFCGVVMAAVDLTLVAATVGLIPDRMPPLVMMILLAIVLPPIALVTCANVIVVTRQINGLLAGLAYAGLMVVLGFAFGIGYFLVPRMIRSDFDRRYGHLLNVPQQEIL